MTSKLTREQLHERARENVKALKLASRQTAFESARKEILADLQLAEIALAAMDSEPVAYTDERNLGYIDRGRETAYLWGKQNSESSDVALYRHAQQPVVEREPIAWLNDAYLARGVVDGEAGSEDAGPGYIPVYREAGPQPAPVVPDDVLDALQKVARIRLDLNDFDGDRRGIADCLCDAEEALIEVVNRRAAMLAAAPHDTPALNSVQSVVTVPGKWIPVSERMPEDRTQVILWDAEIGEVTSGHYSHKTQTFYHCGDAIENEITHWMLPPSAPQGVKP
ncbi:hypothetical protein NUKP55_11130 [Klebsiella variicola]|uniref:DUF551 domain-containing protein n=1 Tax=Klebsiella variicola TaxID=244366 RepID=UPI00218149EE|nr:DUF551 domain-containing protein [Klebsiella variicola]GKL29409.1 hypothetical protein NUKP55_11130 [Klebsiella variicola]HCI9063077.1 DUF551 domain-containing protein [Klebsiella variicola]